MKTPQPLDALSALARIGGTLAVRLDQFEASRRISSSALSLDAPATASVPDFAGAAWEIAGRVSPGDGVTACAIEATVTGGRAKDVALSLSVAFSQWSTAIYVLFPGAAYAGNRFRVIQRSELLSLPSAQSPVSAVDACISNIPRLSRETGKSRMQFLAGDLAVPAVGLYFPQEGVGFFVLTGQRANGCDTSLSLTERDDRGSAELVLRTPGIREEECWKSGAYHPSPDRGISRAAGERLELTCRLYAFSCAGIPDLFAAFMSVRGDARPRVLRQEIPYSATFAIQEQKYNWDSWVEREGYYSVGMRENQWQNWQTGWTGGMNAVYPLLAEGGEQTRQRALRTFDFLFGSGVSPSGFFYDVYHYGAWRGNETNPRKTPQIGLLRRNSDALFFIVKEFGLLRARDPSWAPPHRWLEATRACADAFVRLYRRHGQFGQWVNLHTGEAAVLGSAGNGIAPAALALAAGFFGTREYLDVAAEAARGYHRDHVQRGILNGGPGDALQCPDSESAFGLLESYVTLYEATGDAAWLDMARDAAHQCASWVVSYDFAFPGGSTFARLDMSTTGTVIANAQNKHSAPGICTLSGNSLFRLFRATGNRRYLELIRDIAHAIPQFMSRADRPIPDVRPSQQIAAMPSGWINERVNMSDWEEVGNSSGDIRRGEIFAGSCWSEVSSMLSYAELPGVYVQTDTGLVCAIDHVDARIAQSSANELTVEIVNPTRFDASVKVFAEPSGDCMRALGALDLIDCRRILVPAQGRTEINIPR